MKNSEKANAVNQQKKIDRHSQSLQDSYFRQQAAKAEQLRKRMLSIQKRTLQGGIKFLNMLQRSTSRPLRSGATKGQGTWKRFGRIPSLLMKIHRGGRVSDEYAFGQDGAELIDSNMLGQSPSERKSEFILDQARHPRVNPKSLFVHVTLSRPTDHHLDQHQWKKVVQRFLKKIGVDGNYVGIRHTSTDNDHIHLIFSRSKSDGTLVSMSQNRWAWRQKVREIETELSIAVQVDEVEKTTTTPTSDKLVSAQRRAYRRGSPDPYIDPQVVSQVLGQSSTPEDFAKGLAAVGIDIKSAERNDGAITGILFKNQDAQEWLAGSSISRELSLPKIQIKLEMNRQAVQTRASEILIHRRHSLQNSNQIQRIFYAE